MLDSQLRKIISECVKQILNEKKNILKIGEKPDPLHHLQGSKKIKTTISKNNDKKKMQNTDDCCEPEEKKVQKKHKKSKVFHEKSDEFQHETLEDFNFNKKSKNESKKHGIESALFEEEMTDMPDIEDLNVDDDI